MFCYVTTIVVKIFCKQVVWEDAIQIQRGAKRCHERISLVGEGEIRMGDVTIEVFSKLVLDEEGLRSQHFSHHFGEPVLLRGTTADAALGHHGHEDMPLIVLFPGKVVSVLFEVVNGSLDRDKSLSREGDCSCKGHDMIRAISPKIITLVITGSEGKGSGNTADTIARDVLHIFIKEGFKVAEEVINHLVVGILGVSIGLVIGSTELNRQIGLVVIVGVEVSQGQLSFHEKLIRAAFAGWVQHRRAKHFAAAKDVGSFVHQLNGGLTVPVVMEVSKSACTKSRVHGGHGERFSFGKVKLKRAIFKEI